MAFRFDGAHGTNVRPAHVNGVADWAKDESTPGANDGTRLTASLVNVIVANLRTLATRNGVALGEGVNTIVADAVDAAVAAAIAQATADTLNAGDSIALLVDGGGFVRMTDAERSKLNSLVANFKGVHASLAAVAAAHPSGTSGDWAIITQGSGNEATMAIWDTDESPAAWIDTQASAGVASHTHPISDVTGLQAALDGKAASVHTHAISAITGLQAALDAKAPLASPTFTDSASAPTVNATTALQKKGIGGRIVTAQASEVWTTGFTSSSGTDVEAWLSSEINKAATGEAATLSLDIFASVVTSRSTGNSGCFLRAEIRTHDGSTWSSWSTIRERLFKITSGGATSVAMNGELAFHTVVDLTGKTKWQVRLMGRVETTGSTPSFTLSDAALKYLETL